MDFSSLSDSINGFLYHREYKKLTPADKKLAQIWTLNFIRRNHPDWSEEQVQQHYKDLIKIRTYAVDEWGRRMME
ncbi:MAG: hypothetical protein ACAI35_05325 [Candidatus Methylacidiphilales bacterium]|nr:hypothetical protein [Candidatus Methylacidiphilales bacterium]